jgi:hypothetical protein
MIRVESAIAAMERTLAMHSSREWNVAVRKFNPGGLTANQTTDVKSVYEGFDWESGKFIIEPAAPMTELTPEQVADITTSVRSGSSWHAYQREKKLLERIKALEAELGSLRAKMAGAS